MYITGSWILFIHKNESLIIICFNWKSKVICNDLQNFFWFNWNWTELSLKCVKLSNTVYWIWFDMCIERNAWYIWYMLNILSICKINWWYVGLWYVLTNWFIELFIYFVLLIEYHLVCLVNVSLVKNPLCDHIDEIYVNIFYFVQLICF